MAAAEAQNEKGTGRRRLSKGELTILLDHHALFVAGKGGKRAVLPYVDFSGLDLVGRQLSGADLTGSVFDQARMAAVKLDGTTTNWWPARTHFATRLATLRWRRFVTAT